MQKGGDSHFKYVNQKTFVQFTANLYINLYINLLFYCSEVLLTVCVCVCECLHACVCACVHVRVCGLNTDYLQSNLAVPSNKFCHISLCGGLMT